MVSLTDAQALERRKKYGRNAIPPEHRSAAIDIAARFWGPVPWVLEATLALTLAGRRYGDAIAIAFLLCFNAAVAAWQEGRARRAVDLLRSRITVQARVRRGNAWTVRSAEELVPGDAVHLGSGDVVPADVRLESGSLQVDQSVLTGESQPRTLSAPQTAYAGTIVTRGDAFGTVAATGLTTTYGKTAELVRIAKAPGQLERIVLRIVAALSGVSVALIALISALAIHLGFGVLDVIVFAVMILLASVPIALPAAFTLATTFGSLDLASGGALITRLSALEDAASMDVLCTDKTGTITQNRIAVQEIVAFDPFEPGEVAGIAAAASGEAGQDPVDLAVLRYAAGIHVPVTVRSAFTPFDPVTKFSSARIVWNGEAGTAYKGTPPVLRAMAASAPTSFDAQMRRLAGTGARILAVALSGEGETRLAGLIALADPPRDDAAPLVERLRRLGIRTILVTGDALDTALSVARRVGIAQTAVHASVFPADKLQLIRSLQSQRHVVGMTGDGINDAPALRQATIGIAVSNATDVAKAAAGIVLTQPGLANIVSAVEASRRIFERMLTYTLMKLVKYFEIVGVLSIAFLVTHRFLLTPELMVALLIFNDFVTLAISTDNVTPSQALDVWRVGRLIAAAAPIALATAAAVLGSLGYARDVLHVSLPQLQSVTFLALVLMGQIAVYLVRDRHAVFGPLPSRWLCGASVFAAVSVGAMATAGVLMPPLPLSYVLSIFGFLIGAGALLALLKLAAIRSPLLGGRHGKRDER